MNISYIFLIARTASLDLLRSGGGGHAIGPSLVHGQRRVAVAGVRTPRMSTSMTATQRAASSRDGREAGRAALGDSVLHATCHPWEIQAAARPIRAPRRGSGPGPASDFERYGPAVKLPGILHGFFGAISNNECSDAGPKWLRAYPLLGTRNVGQPFVLACSSEKADLLSNSSQDDKIGSPGRVSGVA